MEGTAVGVGLQDSGNCLLYLVNCLLFLGEGVVEGGIFTLLVPDVVEPAVIYSAELSVIVAIEGLGSEVDCFNLDLTPHRLAALQLTLFQDTMADPVTEFFLCLFFGYL